MRLISLIVCLAFSLWGFGYCYALPQEHPCHHSAKSALHKHHPSHHAATTPACCDLQSSQSAEAKGLQHFLPLDMVLLPAEQTDIGINPSTLLANSSVWQHRFMMDQSKRYLTLRVLLN